MGVLLFFLFVVYFQISSILKKKENERTEDEVCMLTRLPEVVKTAEKNAQKQLQKKERIQEVCVSELIWCIF